MTTNSSSYSYPHHPYIGRFAPSPSGPLHFGSLVSALASYLDAKAHHGKWLVRMEDIDPPREVDGAATTILQQLQQHGLCWDEDVLYQSQRSKAYLIALEQLKQSHRAYLCQCSRQQLKEKGGIHNYSCLPGDPTKPSATRLVISNNAKIEFTDIFQDQQQQDIKHFVGDMVLYRKDGLFAYQLAVVIDDAFQNITHVIRGSDLLDSTPRQIYLQQQLMLHTPQYGHIPVATNLDGQKLSKQNLAAPLSHDKSEVNLATAIRWLGLPLPELHRSNCHELLTWAVQHWQRKLIPPVLERLASS